VFCQLNSRPLSPPLPPSPILQHTMNFVKDAENMVDGGQGQGQQQGGGQQQQQSSGGGGFGTQAMDGSCSLRAPPAMKLILSPRCR
jgi:hypothetical protein